IYLPDNSFLIINLFYSDYKGINALPFDIMRETDYGSFYDEVMHIQRIFYFRSANTVSAYIQHIIYTTGDFVIPFLISNGTIAGKIFVRVSRKIYFPAALIISPSSA